MSTEEVVNPETPKPETVKDAAKKVAETSRDLGKKLAEEGFSFLRKVKDAAKAGANAAKENWKEKK